MATAWKELPCPRSLKFMSSALFQDRPHLYPPALGFRYNITDGYNVLVSFVFWPVEVIVLDSVFVDSNNIGKVFKVGLNNVLPLSPVVLIIVEPKSGVVVVVIVVVILF
jgi:hypothetical protein